MSDNIKELCIRFLDENAYKWLSYYYENHITNALITKHYFQNCGGNDWETKYKLSKPYLYYQECINGNMFKKELKNIKKYALIDMLEIIKNYEINGGIIIKDYSDIYYTYEQFEFIYRQLS